LFVCGQGERGVREAKGEPSPVKKWKEEDEKKNEHHGAQFCRQVGKTTRGKKTRNLIDCRKEGKAPKTGAGSVKKKKNILFPLGKNVKGKILHHPWKKRNTITLCNMKNLWDIKAKATQVIKLGKSLEINMRSGKQQ